MSEIQADFSAFLKKFPSFLKYPMLRLSIFVKIDGFKPTIEMTLLFPKGKKVMLPMSYLRGK